MNILNKNYREDIIRINGQSKFIEDIGIKFEDCGVGWCEFSLDVENRHHQHSGVVHAGVISTLLDNAAGAAAYTMMPQGANPLTVEFKVNLMRAADGERLECRSTVLKPGKLFSVLESEVYSVKSGERKLVAKATLTIVGV